MLKILKNKNQKKNNLTIFERFNTPVFEADFILESTTFFPRFVDSDDELEPMIILL